MMETLRQLIERYPAIPPLVVQTELSSGRVPAYALSQRAQQQQWQDVQGCTGWQGEFAFQMRSMATGEGDRRQARAFLQALGGWVEAQCGQGQPFSGATAGLPALQEAYDDGTAAWSMTLLVDWQKN